MATIVELAAIALLIVGSAFFAAGTVALLRFPDVFTRLHGLTKADNLGLGFVVLALVMVAEGWAARAKLLLIWLLVLAATATAGHVMARAALERGVKPWERAP
jgi:multicomponent Na+:H+ antiporter subunit G